ncbi:glycosyl hydrolase family 28 protein [uncultured Draconibacterium sp.]|uniref:glycoside hydrolase family 28 protein n=1 Tax=uncultured Draconibacterium sp. TaxID=1573823 RepID=UPI0029C91E7B|nr:glycosyl hydrolase family 28 protein [uncultured Draconibacterium sp.]
MRKLVVFISVLLIFVGTLRASEYNIKDFGALENSLTTQAIQDAVDRCNSEGGGTVIIPSGKFIIGTVILKSNVTIYLEQGALLAGSKNLTDYKATFRTHGLFFCENAENISITGKGTIDARGTQFFDATKNHVYDEFDKQRTRQKENYMPKGEFFSDGPIGKQPKPGMTIAFFHCSRVTLEDFVLKDTPSWGIRLAYCDDVLVHGLTIRNNLMVPNSDGVHCTTSRNVRMSDCDISAGDDAFIVTGFSKKEEEPGYTMKEQEKYTFGNKSEYAENINVDNCLFQSRSSGIRIGYGQHPIRRCIFNNITIYGSNRGIGIFAHDASDIEELIFSNIIIETRLHNGQWWGNGEPIHLSSISRFEGHAAGEIKNVQFNNIVATGEHGIILYGLEESCIQDVDFNNISLTVLKGKETINYGGNFDLRPAADIKMQIFKHDIPGLYAQYVDGLSIRNFKLRWGNGLPDFYTHGISCFEVSDLSLVRFDGIANPNSAYSAPVKLNNTTIKK